jgi:hypothetical protein
VVFDPANGIIVSFDCRKRVVDQHLPCFGAGRRPARAGSHRPFVLFRHRSTRLIGKSFCSCFFRLDFFWRNIILLHSLGRLISSGSSAERLHAFHLADAISCRNSRLRYRWLHLVAPKLPPHKVPFGEREGQPTDNRPDEAFASKSSGSQTPYAAPTGSSSSRREMRTNSQPHAQKPGSGRTATFPMGLLPKDLPETLNDEELLTWMDEVALGPSVVWDDSSIT